MIVHQRGPATPLDKLENGEKLFEGEGRGVCGDTHDADLGVDCRWDPTAKLKQMAEEGTGEGGEIEEGRTEGRIMIEEYLREEYRVMRVSYRAESKSEKI